MLSSTPGAHVTPVDATPAAGKNAPMDQLIRTAESQLARLDVPVAVRLPGGRTLGSMQAGVVLDVAMGTMVLPAGAEQEK